MTNLFNLSQRPKIVFFHGINNNAQCFRPFMNHFKNIGYDTELIILPGHGENRKEAKNARDAQTLFDQSMKKLKGTPYHAIAFSHGALYLQLWLEKNHSHKPIKQVLLAPAFYIHRQKMIEKLLKILPNSFVTFGLAPKAVKLYKFSAAWEFNILVQGMLTYQKIRRPFKIPTLVLIDPKDELVDAPKLKNEIEQVEFFPRPYLKKGFTTHHVLFHPDYFQEQDWLIFTKKIEDFLVN